MIQTQHVFDATLGEEATENAGVENVAPSKATSRA